MGSLGVGLPRMTTMLYGLELWPVVHGLDLDWGGEGDLGHLRLCLLLHALRTALDGAHLILSGRARMRGAAVVIPRPVRLRLLALMMCWVAAHFLVVLLLHLVDYSTRRDLIACPEVFVIVLILGPELVDFSLEFEFVLLLSGYLGNLAAWLVSVRDVLEVDGGDLSLLID